MFIMTLLVLSIRFMENLLDLLVDVLNLLNESGGFVEHRLIKGQVCLCGGKKKCNMNGSQGLESQTHLKWAMAGGAMDRPIVAMLDIWETLVPCTGMIRIVHVQDVHNHLIDNLSLAIGLGVERSGFCELGVQERPETRPKGVEEPIVSIEDDGLSYPKMDPNSFEEELGNICRCDILLTGYENGHLRKLINDHKHTFIFVLGGWKTRHVIH
jgi:hypothetical protein